MKKIFKSNIKIIVLAVLTVISATLFFTSDIFQNESISNKTTVKGKNGYNYNNYNGNTDYNYDYDYLSSNIDLPTVYSKTSTVIGLFEDFNPYELISSTGNIKVIYSNVDNTRVGNYIVSYSVCSNESDARCRYVNTTVLVRDLDDKYIQYEEYDDSKSATVKWENNELASCKIGSNSCLPKNIKYPTAIDPYQNDLAVEILSSNVNINKAGYYYITYGTTNDYGINSTTVRQVQIVDDNDKYESNSYSGNIKSKKIGNYKWINNVEYSYKCINKDLGVNAWQYQETLNNDDHSTFYYNDNGYTGILTKDRFYERNPYDGDIRELLGECNRNGEIKTLTRTWVGIYSGTVYNYEG